MFETLEELGIYFGAFALAMLSNTILGVVQSGVKQEFKWSILIKGVLKYIGIFAGAAVLISAGALLPEVTLIDVSVGDQQVKLTLLSLWMMIALTGFIKYSLDAISKFLALVKIKWEDVIGHVQGKEITEKEILEDLGQEEL